MAAAHPAVLSLLVFAVTLGAATVRPRGLNEAWWTGLGAAAVLVLGLSSAQRAWAIVWQARNALLFLLALLVLSALLERSGFFDWAAIHAARRARGRTRTLFRNVFLLGSATTAFMSLDTTAVMLTPLVLAFVKRLDLRPRPFVLVCAFVANAASLLLPISNLTNLLFADGFGISFAGFAAGMLAPQVVALTVTYGLLSWLFRKDLPERFPVERLPEPGSAVPDRRFFRAAVAALATVVVGYFVAPLVHLEPYAPAFGVAALLAAYGLVRGQLDLAVVRGVSWPIFPFVIGLFIVVGAVLDHGLAGWAAAGYRALPASLVLRQLGVVAGAAASSNLANNLPAALLARAVLAAEHAPPRELFAALIGTNLGPNLLAFGSLATLLVLGRARDAGFRVGVRDFLSVGLVVTPVALLTSTFASVWIRS